MTFANSDAFDWISGTHDSLIVVCDHASNRIPPEYNDLGLDRGSLNRHIAYDIGAAGVARELARRFCASAVLSTFSRLLIDPNRGADDPTLVMRLSDGAVIPGNAAIDAAEIAARRDRFWTPYRQAVAAQIQRIQLMHKTPCVVSIHSFTPIFHGETRIWTCSALWDRDDRVARPFITGLRETGEIVGDNQPYDGALKGDALYDLCTMAGLPHILIEIRQDLAEREDQQMAWAKKIATVLEPILDRPELKQPKFFGSRAG